MTPRLLDTLKALLRERGYVEVEHVPDGGGLWQHPDGCVDKLVPTIIDCLEREA